MREGTPLITTVPYVYEAFSQVYAIDEDQKWLRIMRSIAEHAFRSYRDIGDGAGYRELRLYPRRRTIPAASSTRVPIERFF